MLILFRASAAYPQAKAASVSAGQLFLFAFDQPLTPQNQAVANGWKASWGVPPIPRIVGAPSADDQIAALGARMIGLNGRETTKSRRPDKSTTTGTAKSRNGAASNFKLWKA
jgi:hypothetical protein